MRLGFRLQWSLAHCSSVPVSTMSGRVGDLSPKQAETLAKVRDGPFPVGSQGKRLGHGLEGWPGPRLHLLILHALTLSLPYHLQRGLHPTQTSDINPDQNGC